MKRAGIVGLPNVGKSTLFNALIENHQAESANYPFCTIEPNVGIVNLPDLRLDKLAKISKTDKIVPAAFEFVDIAGLVKGASKGEGLGNKFLSHIREVDAIIHVVRCFEDSNITHVDNSIDPIRDIETISMELALCDIQSIEKRIDSVSKKIKANEKDSKRQLEILNEVLQLLNDGKPLTSLQLEDEDIPFYNSLFLLSNKPVIYACNVSEEEVSDVSKNKHFDSVKKYAAERGSKCVPVCAKLESELIVLDEEERAEFTGNSESGIKNLIKEAFELLGLMTFFTAGEKEVRAWTIKKESKAPQAAGAIHTDFERGFIKAEVIKYDDLVKLGSKVAARDSGVARLEGKDYIVQDSDIIEFKFNV